MADATGTAKNTPKTAATVTTEGEKEKPVKEVPVIYDQAAFLHQTGDTYDGNFEAKKKDHSVRMHGEVPYRLTEFKRCTFNIIMNPTAY